MVVGCLFIGMCSHSLHLHVKFLFLIRICFLVGTVAHINVIEVYYGATFHVMATSRHIYAP
jgi:hypothetical protein